MKNNNSNSGFTLVELSIVLVIIGLLVGGVLQGQELIEASKRQSVISDVQEYTVALNTFKLQYGQNNYPGDFNEAEDYWGSSVTNNGDNNKKVGFNTSAESEVLRFWQHLSLAGLIKGDYTGVAKPGKTDDFASPNLNVPSSSYGSHTGYWMFYRETHSLYGKINFHMLHFGSNKNQDNRLYSGAITPRSAKQIDVKLDDGLASQGKLRAGNQTASSPISGCVTPSTPYYSTASATYDLTSDLENCTLHFIMD